MFILIAVRGTQLIIELIVAVFAGVLFVLGATARLIAQVYAAYRRRRSARA